MGPLKQSFFPYVILPLVLLAVSFTMFCGLPCLGGFLSANWFFYTSIFFVLQAAIIIGAGYFLSRRSNVSPGKTALLGAIFAQLYSACEILSLQRIYFLEGNALLYMAFVMVAVNAALGASFILSGWLLAKNGAAKPAALMVAAAVILMASVVFVPQAIENTKPPIDVATRHLLVSKSYPSVYTSSEEFVFTNGQELNTQELADRASLHSGSICLSIGDFMDGENTDGFSQDYGSPQKITWNGVGKIAVRLGAVCETNRYLLDGQLDILEKRADCGGLCLERGLCCAVVLEKP